nr:rRNA methyltransferase 1, mitochondrial [Pelodiscus sinensis]|eukprot:XP_006138689.1 rRNA methyltransferase 1, mitochondrial [Pelodiscus sinensis]
MAFVMDMVQIFKFSMLKAARLSFAFSCKNHFQAAKHFSTQEKEPPQSASPPGFEDEGNSHHHDSHQLQISGVEDAARMIPKSNPPPRSYIGLAPQKNLQWKWKSSMRNTGQAASSSEEFRNLREDDFSKERKRPAPKPMSFERTKGSEILFGIAPCSLAFSQSKRNFFRLFLKSGSSSARPVMEEFAQRAKARGVPVHRVRRQVLDTLCKGQVHQGVCLEATPLHPRSLEEAEVSQVGVATVLGTQLIWLVLEKIQDPMNLGAVVRSAHYLGVDRVVTSLKDSCPLTPMVSKASAGAMEVLEIYGTDDLQRFLKTKTEEGWEVIGTVGKSEVKETVPVINCLEFHWNKPTVLVIGNEGYGLSSETRNLCHRMLIIPPGRTLQPGIESLNVSVATGILLHSICSQKIK